MFHGDYTLAFTGHALFHQSTVKSGNFNVVRSLDAPQVTTLYGAMAQCASMMDYDLEILDRVSLTPPEPVSSVIRNKLILTAPLSPFDWQPKWVSREGKYETLRRVYPREAYPLWKPLYKLHIFAEDKEAMNFVSHSFRILADHSNWKVGGNLRLGYKKKLFGSFDCQASWEAEPLREKKLRGAMVCEVFSDCPTRFNAVVPLQPKIRTLTFRNVHREKGVKPNVYCNVYAPESVVLLKQNETRIRWFNYNDASLGVSDLIERRAFGDEKVKAVQGLFLSY